MNLGEFLAEHKRLAADLGDTVGDGDFLETVTISEHELLDDGDTIGNRKGGK